MHPDLILTFKHGVAPRADGDDVLLADPRGGVVRWSAPGAGWRRVIDCLAGAGADLDTLAGLLAEAGGAVDWARLHHRLNALDAKGLLSRTIATEDGRPLATLHPLSPRARPGSGPVDPAARYRLSRFAVLRTEGGRWELVTPLGHAKLLIHEGRVLALLARLAEPATPTQLRAAWPELAQAAVAALLAMLVDTRAADVCDGAGALAEAQDTALTQWEPVDLLFHSRSRRGRHDDGFGGTFRFLERIDPLPAVRPADAATLLPLPVPDLERLRREDPPFAAVVESRRSLRDYTGRRLTLDHLGEFLYRCARIERVYGPDRAQGRPYQVSRRPYPGAGAAYELELYLAVAACAGLAPGLYRYAPESHGLEPVSGPTPALAALLEEARAAAAAPAAPPLLIVLTARFQRLAWKYQAMAYAAVLKDVGVLFHQFYLNAAAMGLAPCALGGGDPDLFAEAAGLDYYREGSVGEFMLGGAAQ